MPRLQSSGRTRIFGVIAPWATASTSVDRYSPPPKVLRSGELFLRSWDGQADVWVEFHFTLTDSELSYHRVGHPRSQAKDHAMVLHGSWLSSAPVLAGSRQADMAHGIERYPFQLRKSSMTWVLSGANVDDTVCV